MSRGVDGATTHFELPKGAPWAEKPVMLTEREKLTAGIVADLVELSDADLRAARSCIGSALAAAKASGTARKLDGATLAREQAEREAPGFGCHHEPACEGACPARSFPPAPRPCDHVGPCGCPGLEDM